MPKPIDRKYGQAFAELGSEASVEQSIPMRKQSEPRPATRPKVSQSATQTRNVGRPRGKRSNPDWEQLTLYIRKDTKQAALRRLVDEDSKLDLSEVIDQILARWAKSLQL